MDRHPSAGTGASPAASCAARVRGLVLLLMALLRRLPTVIAAGLGPTRQSSVPCGTEFLRLAERQRILIRRARQETFGTIFR
jgi:hypothetical protein